MTRQQEYEIVSVLCIRGKKTTDNEIYVAWLWVTWKWETSLTNEYFDIRKWNNTSFSFLLLWLCWHLSYVFFSSHFLMRYKRRKAHQGVLGHRKLRVSFEFYPQKCVITAIFYFSTYFFLYIFEKERAASRDRPPTSPLTNSLKQSWAIQGQRS